MRLCHNDPVVNRNKLERPRFDRQSNIQFVDVSLEKQAFAAQNQSLQSFAERCKFLSHFLLRIQEFALRIGNGIYDVR